MTIGSKPDLRIESARLAQFVSELLEAASVPRPLASEWAASLIWANLRGVDSHGVLRVPRYLDLLKKKTINPDPNIRVERRAGAIVVLEADRAPGAIAMARAMAEAIACAGRPTSAGVQRETSPMRGPSATSRCKPLRPDSQGS